MFERKDLEALAAYRGSHPVVSLYLHLDPRLRTTPEAYKALLRGLLKEAAAAEASEQEFDWSGRGVVVFSSAGDDFFEAFQFMVPVRSHVHIGRKPFIQSLVDLVETYGSYTVALVDKQNARFFHFHLGELVAQDRFEGEDVKRLKAGGGAGGAGRSRGNDLSGYGREVVRANLRHASEALNTFCTKHRTEHLLFGGSEPTVAQFQGMIAPRWKGCLEGVFVIDMHASEVEVREQSLDALRINQEKRQAELIETIRTAASKGSNGAVGPEDTLAAVHAGRVQTLVVLEGFHVPGYRCNGCGFVTAEQRATCSFCGGEMSEFRDVVEHAIRHVVEQGASVEFVEVDSTLKELGNIGALLRY